MCQIWQKENSDFPGGDNEKNRFNNFRLIISNKRL